MSVRKIGDWNLVNFATRNLSDDMQAASKIALRRIGSETEKRVVKRIVSQPSEWQPLKGQYLQRKEKEGYSNKILIQTGAMLQSITTDMQYPRVFTGVKRGARNKEGGDLVNIAAVHEFGSQKRNIPARPMFGPIYREMIKKIQEEGYFIEELYKIMRRKYGIK